MDVSVIVCTRNRADSLARCLASIAADPSTTPAEVIVVDNGSTDHTKAVLAAHNVVPLLLPKPGKCAALNLAVAAARGDILLFTDDDATVQPGWIDAMTAAFEDSEVGAVGGRIVPTYLCDRPEWLTDDNVFDPVTLPDYGEKPFRFEDGDIRLPIGANMAIRASVLPRDPFNVNLGHTGRLSLGFDEFTLMTALRCHHEILYVPEAVVLHLLDEKRLTLATARRTLFQLGFGLARYRKAFGAPTPSLPRRIVRTARAWRRVHQATNLIAELDALRRAGEQTEWLLGAAPWLANWSAGHLTRP